MLDDRPVVVMWMAEVKEVVHVDQQFSVMVGKMKIGKACKRDFLKPGCTDVVMTRGTNSVRRSCVTLYLDDSQWPPDLLQKCKSYFLFVCIHDIVQMHSTPV